MSIGESRQKRRAAKEAATDQPEQKQPTAAGVAAAPQVDIQALVREAIRAELTPALQELQTIRTGVELLIQASQIQAKANEAQAQDRRELQFIHTAVELLTQAVQALTTADADDEDKEEAQSSSHQQRLQAQRPALSVDMQPASAAAATNAAPTAASEEDTTRDDQAQASEIKAAEDPEEEEAGNVEEGNGLHAEPRPESPLKRLKYGPAILEIGTDTGSRQRQRPRARTRREAQA
jgi:hypothetical protein